MIHAYEDPGIFVRGGAVSRPNGEKTALKTFLCLFMGFWISNLFYSLQRVSNGFIAEKTMLFQGNRGGPTFREVQLFTGGSKC